MINPKDTSTDTPLTINETIAQLQHALRDYIEATYHVSDLQMVAQRKALLDEEGVIYQRPYIESTPRYEAGAPFADIAGLHPTIGALFTNLSERTDDQKPLLFNPPYTHQADAIAETLVRARSLIVMTGTGSGKTESFLMPILGKLALEASTKPKVFKEQSAVRALILYPMNALVNDQLGRLRLLFGDRRVGKQFKDWAGRPLRFARYTSRTLYPGVRTAKKDGVRLAPLDRYYVEHLRRAAGDPSIDQAHSEQLVKELKARGKWPAKPDLVKWYGAPGTRWFDEKSQRFKRCVALPDDQELWTRHEVHDAPPDVLVTNYSMLEYMLMRPLERSIFDATKAWLTANPNEQMMLVLDEAHLYRGAGGSEVALLIRRVTQRLGILPSRLQVICTTASFDKHSEAPSFAAQLTGKDASDFTPIVGTLLLRKNASTGSTSDAEMLASIVLPNFYSSDRSLRAAEAKKATDYLSMPMVEAEVEKSLYAALCDFPPMSELINRTMKAAQPVNELATIIFPGTESRLAERAVTSLLAIGSAARLRPDEAGLLPCRIHAFFRGLPGLWVCMDPHCTARGNSDHGSAGKLYAQPSKDVCECGARVLELFTCRQCGTLYARAYTDDLQNPQYLWSEPGQVLQSATGLDTPLEPIDLLLEEPPAASQLVQAAEFDLVTGRLDTPNRGDRWRTVYIKRDRTTAVDDSEGSSETTDSGLGEFKPCAACEQFAAYGRSSVQDHQTKGDQPFQALVTKQIQIQPPGPMEATPLAPLRGRKVLIFSDSRQTAARLAPNIQKYSTQDALRPLICEGFRHLQSFPSLAPLLSLDDVYLAVLLSAKRLDVRLRPELKAGEGFNEEPLVSKYVLQNPNGNEARLLQLMKRMTAISPPESLFSAMLSAFDDRYYGLEALALASIVEQDARREDIYQLPTIPGLAESDDEKLQLVRLWLRQWQRLGFWLGRMPQGWELDRVKTASGLFPKQTTRILRDANARTLFNDKWIPRLRDLFCETVSDKDKKFRLKGNELSLSIGGTWAYCRTCQTAQRPGLRNSHCVACGADKAAIIDPETDLIFTSRKGYYRASTIGALASPRTSPLSLIAAEHTAQLGSAQADDVFSKAEENELLFQDVDLGVDDEDHIRPAIDILSCTTTMEVGIDIGALSGVSLRNMPPSRANYQQRAGRAGRRGNAVATVTTFGSADSHDEHFFSSPAAMISGRVDDPRLTLDNKDIIRRHVFAFVLQRYHQERIPVFDPDLPPSLFAVLGSTVAFSSPTSRLNREDFEKWLKTNESELRAQINSWIPKEFAGSPRASLLGELVANCLHDIDKALHYEAGEKQPATSDESDDASSATGEADDEADVAPTAPNLLDRLLYKGVLPRYAFPTDVATFYVFDRKRSDRFRPVYRFTPSQGLSVALSQYAPGKEVWISGKQYRSGAIYSPSWEERSDAWKNRRVYFECVVCGYARTFPLSQAESKETRDCPACNGGGTFGIARYWLRPPGFAHPAYDGEETSPDDQPARSYATRAKLAAPTPADAEAWLPINERMKMYHLKDHLLVTNRGPAEEGYDYCTSCGIIEPASSPSSRLNGIHRKPYVDEKEPDCKGGYVTRGIVLGTDFITDVLLVSLTVDKPLDLTPSSLTTTIALRTLCEALSKAACLLLDLEPAELQAEFRPALTPLGARGLQMELYLYDTLAGGAGFCKQIEALGERVFTRALEILETCAEHCDRSCYRCLRSYKNKFDHEYLDRHVGTALLRYLLRGEQPTWDASRLEASREIIFQDLLRQNHPDVKIRRNETVALSDDLSVVAPIYVERKDGIKAIIDVSGAMTPRVPADPILAENAEFCFTPIWCVEELRVRRNLPRAAKDIWERLGL
jgi:ATP-dependent helicase YprA (DUF1998 family)